MTLFGKYVHVKGGDYYPAVLWAKFMIRIFLLPMKVVGLENLEPDKKYIFVANHQGFWDVFMMFGYLGHNFKWMMKDSLRKTLSSCARPIMAPANKTIDRITFFIDFLSFIC